MDTDIAQNATELLVVYQFDGHLLAILYVHAEVELPEGSATNLLPELELAPDDVLHTGHRNPARALHPPPPTPPPTELAPTSPHPDPSHAPQTAPQTDRIAQAPLASIGPGHPTATDAPRAATAAHRNAESTSRRRRSRSRGGRRAGPGDSGGDPGVVGLFIA
uniref:Uncharacterized protein n=1 Tax=Arundo donax TaxID=35708 RepID=A0A0A9AEZ4_ARUDO